LEKVLLVISAGNGPEECAHAVALTLKAIQQETLKKGINSNIVETKPSLVKDNFRSVIVSLEGENIESFINTWLGVVQWIWDSTYRPHHKRKNWFVSVNRYTEPIKNKMFSTTDVRFETARASGPGGQYVNKTETAVRAIHTPSGKSAVARDERSQLLNKRVALQRLEEMFQIDELNKESESRSKLRHTHWEIERGNPIRIYDASSKKLLK